MTENQFREMFDPRITGNRGPLTAVWASATASIITRREAHTNIPLSPEQVQRLIELRDWAARLLAEV